MKSLRAPLLLPLILLFGTLSPAVISQPASGLDPPLHRHEYQVDSAIREALVYAPASAKSNPAPVVFILHGHGGNATNAARSFAMHQHWPQAISIYMQGLNTPGRLTDPEGKKSGWQVRPGDLRDRDLKFFDEALAQLKKDYKIEPKRIYCTGHSNGGAFTYLLWQARGDVLAAVAPSASAGPFWDRMKISPKPVLHLAGEKDTLVKYEWQQRTMEIVRTINKCVPDGKPREGKLAGPGVCTIYESKAGAPCWCFIHPGGHTFPAAAPQLIAEFFQKSF